MKIIHTADLHLESKMGVNLNTDQAKKRRNELLFTFENLIIEAKKLNVNVIIIAGDMFDTKSINKKTKEILTINKHINKLKKMEIEVSSIREKIKEKYELIEEIENSINLKISKIKLEYINEIDINKFI